MSVRFTNAGSYTVAAALPGSQLHTLCCWAKSSVTTPTDTTVIHLDNGTDSDSSRIGLVDLSGTFSGLFVQHRTGVGSTAAFSTLSPATGWHHYALVIDGTNQLGYVDGALVSTNAFNPTLRVTAFTILRMGAQNVAPEDQNQQDAMVFTSALTANEIKTVMLGRIPKTQVANLYGWWPLHGDSLLQDYSGHGRTLSTTGGTPVAGNAWAPASWSAMQQRAMRVPFNASAIALTGALTETTGASGTLDSTSALTGTDTTTTGASAVLTNVVPITGTSTTTTGATGTLLSTSALTGASTTTTGASGALFTLKPITGSQTTTTGAVGALTTAVPITGSDTTTTGATGALSQAQPLTGTDTTTTGASGTISIVGSNFLVGTSTTTTGASGVLLQLQGLSGSATTTTGAIATLTNVVPLTAAFTTLTSAAATMTQLNALTGASTTVTSMFGVLSNSGNTGSGRRSNSGALRRFENGAEYGRRRLRR